MSNKQPSIKIFVSNRIDTEAKHIENPLYIPVRCGACYDKQESAILGDDTGDNISEKRMSFNELTVLYWAWKNQSADYFGLCHYRRYLAFKDSVYKEMNTEHAQGCVYADDISDETIIKFGLQEENMRSEIAKYDAIFFTPINLKKLKIKSNYEAIKKCPSWHNIKDTDLMMAIIKEKSPDMYDVAYEYMHKHEYSYLYNCFIMRSDVFDKFCSWLFSILFELEKRIDSQNYSVQLQRTLGTCGERLVGIWALWMHKQNIYKIKHNPLLFIENTAKSEEILPAFQENNIVIACSSSDLYVPYLSVWLQSILAHANPKNNYDIFVFEQGITDKNKCKLLNIVNETNISLRFINPKPLLAGLNLKYPSHYALECYFRLTAPIILKNFDKVLFTDVDLVFQKDPGDLYATDLKGIPMAACVDLVWGAFLNNPNEDWMDYAKNVLKLDDPYRYFNTGVVLFNIRQFQNKKYAEKLLESVSKTTFRILEQDALNAFFKSDIIYLDTKWNFATENNIFKNHRLFEYMPARFYKQYQSDKVSPNIIHWAGGRKPWIFPDEEFADIWWSYARKTPFYEEILLRMTTAHVAGLRGGVLPHSKRYLRIKRRLYRTLKHLTTGKLHKRFKDKYNRYNQMLKAA